MDIKKVLNNSIPKCMTEPFVKFNENLKNFASSIIINRNDCVRIRDIVGCNNLRQNEGNSWISVFRNAERMEDNLNLFNSHPEYYYDNSIKEHTSYICMDGKYFVECGKHRTSIAKALNGIDGLEFLYGVSTANYKIDYELFEAYNKLCSFINGRKDLSDRIIIYPAAKYIKIEEYKNSGLIIETYKPYISIIFDGRNEMWFLDDIKSFLL